MTRGSVGGSMVARLVIRLGDNYGREEDLFELVLVAPVGVGDVVLQGLGARELVVGGGGGDNVAVPSNLTGEAGDRSGDFELW